MVKHHTKSGDLVSPVPVLAMPVMGNWRTREGGLQLVAGLNPPLIASDS
ncbi:MULTISPECIES: hypothetical protein [Nostoc]|uniref:Uncharacterized protein n=2 Tax=Nostoc TaxID=1177 RepID=A0ABR8IHZ7_9NOSO|nr:MULTISPECIES: hypothetical protein [Nostoc]MBD2565200.1 hypothetical protein [Nostoc linckia FACHB-391]MBD2651113.1 hypothetical protein [Nostoc foliaceum FACHB-393]